MTSVTWHQVQQALKACIAKHPIVDQVLPKESSPTRCAAVLHVNTTEALDLPCYSSVVS